MPSNLQDNCNAIVSADYTEQTRRSMQLLNEKELPFELIDSLITYITGLGIPGAILIFLPGWNLIFALHKHLSDHPVFGKSLTNAS
jgi:ATP-dependent RNA helicase A